MIRSLQVTLLAVALWMSSTTLAQEVDSTTSEPPAPLGQEAYCKNPFTVTCSSPWPSSDPTGKVWSDVTGEVRALRMLRELIQKQPQWTSEQVQEKLVEDVYSPDRRAKVEDVFKWAQKNILSFINDQPDSLLSKKEKTLLIGQIEKIQLELPPPMSIYADVPDLVTKNTVYYERTAQKKVRLRVGGAYLLNTTSWYNLAYTFAHELAHSIDPCEVQRLRSLPRAYAGLMRCFVESEWVAEDKMDCKNAQEQVSEVFADWVAASITGRALNDIAKDYSIEDRVRSAINSTRDLCEQSSGTDTLNLNRHQLPKLRIGTIMGKNPYVHQALQCKEVLSITNTSYCQFKIPTNSTVKDKKI